MATQINAFYQQHAMSYAEISDDMRVFTLPSEKTAGVSYAVRCERTVKGVEAVNCECRDFEYRRHDCKHMNIVNKWIDRILSSICEVEAGRWYIVNSDTQVWVQNGQWVSAGPTENAVEIVERHLEKQKVVTPAVEEPIVETPAQEVAEVAVIEEVAPEVAPVVVEPKQTYRIISLGHKKERRDLVGDLTASRELKSDMLGEIREIQARAKSEDIGMRGSFGSKPFSIWR